ncbi:MAG: helix-turn-helix transcriptional regulator [Rhizobiaceae bacterium]|nr:helix-turn-helix transcriptional regulator [Rhizobiaceae bacterium]
MSSTPQLSNPFTGKILDEDEVEAFVSQVGARVRETRLQKAISRRVLSELSGVSQRYLAKLEAGSGNISIALLFKVAHALGRDPQFFLSQRHADSKSQFLIDRFSMAGPDVQARVTQILEAIETGSEKKQRICLIGLRGAGKSTLGGMLSKMLGLEFIELNAAIERESGMPVSEVIALYGQEGYRTLEHQAVQTVVDEHEQVVLAVGGGIVSEPDTFNLVLRCFHTVWLKASPEEHMQRVRDQGDNRPMAGNPRAMDELRSILTSREALYARADLMVDTSSSTPEKSVEKLKTALLQDLDLDLDA